MNITNAPTKREQKIENVKNALFTHGRDRTICSRWATGRILCDVGLVHLSVNSSEYGNVYDVVRKYKRSWSNLEKCTNEIFEILESHLMS